MGTVRQIRMKAGILPSKFECQSDEKRMKRDSMPRSLLKKQRKPLADEKETDNSDNPLTLQQNISLLSVSSTSSCE